MKKLEIFLQMSHPFIKLENTPYEELFSAIESLKPQAIAVILYFLPTQLSGKLLLDFSSSKKKEIMQKMDLLSPLDREAMESLAEIINSKFNRKSSRVQLDGKRILSGLIKYSSPELKKCISSIASPTQGFTNINKKIRFEDLSIVPNKYFQKLIKEIDRKTLLLAIKTEAERFTQKLYENLSDAAQKLLDADRQILGPVKKRDVIQAQESIVKLAYSLEEKGLLVFEDSGEVIN